jgi:putative membrane protein
MVNLLLNWLVAAAAVYITAYLLPGVVLSGFVAALVVALVLGGINAFIRPLVIVLTLPITIVTLGLFTFVINAVLVLLTSAVVPGFAVESFWWALLFSIVLSLVNAGFFAVARQGPA